MSIMRTQNHKVIHNIRRMLVNPIMAHVSLSRDLIPSPHPMAKVLRTKTHGGIGYEVIRLQWAIV